MTEASLAEGTAVGRYRVGKLIGAGGMGEVYLATDESLGRPVALKVLPPELMGDRKRVERFATEAKAASALSHPGIVTIYETGEELVAGGRVHFIAMEWIDGFTLRDWLQRAPMLSDILARLAEVAEAVGSAHSRGIIHRDLKPDNIMITADGHAKVLDFGVAKLLEIDRAESRDAKARTLTDSFAVPGTIGYMSPEQVEGMGVDHRSDIFSIGCIIVECATGRSPFIGGTNSETLHNIVHRPPPPLALSDARAGKALQPIVDRCLEKDREHRYDSARDVSLDLRSASRLVERSRPRLLPRRIDWRWLRRVPVGLLVVIAVALLLRVPLLRVDSLSLALAPSKNPEIQRLQTMLAEERQQNVRSAAALTAREQEIARRSAEIERLRTELDQSDHSRAELEASYRKLLIDVNADLRKNSSERSELRARVVGAEAELERFRSEQRKRASEQERLTAIQRQLSAVVETRQEARGLVLTIPGAYFSTGGSRLPSEASTLIEQVAQELSKHPDLKIVIEGHTDHRGSQEGNLELSQERADAVRHELSQAGVPPASMVTTGRGESMPLPGGYGEANRRVEIIVHF